MAAPKAMAALTSGLLARKGAAQPAMRRAGAPAVPGEDALGWNDMGDDGPARDGAVPGAAVPAVIVERGELASRLQSGGVAAPASDTGRKAAFTLRLDAERHLKLRLACAVERRSAQQIVTQALDVFLAGNPEIDRLAQRLPRDGGE